MRCTYCHSMNVMWDYGRGCVVCGDCGTVLDVIYYFHPTINLQEEQPTRNSRHANNKPSISKHTKTYLRLMRKASEYGLEVDNEVFKKYSSGVSPLIKVFKKPNVDLSRLTAEEPVKIVLDVIRKYPRLASRTDRAKVALAKIALSIVSESDIDIKKLSHELGISEVHIRRLHRVITDEFGFLSDVRRIIINNGEVKYLNTT